MSEQSTEQLARIGTPIAGFGDGESDFQLMRQLGTAVYGGASVGETFAAADNIRRRGPDSWSEVFAGLGDRARSDGEERASRGHMVSARDQFLRACNSYRAAEYFTPNKAPRHAELGLLSRDAFAAAMKLSPWDFESVTIQVDGLNLPGYHISPPGSAATNRLLVATSGFDGTTEETYLQVGAAALDRGWQLLLVAGPGQMDTARTHPDTFFVPDAERWMSPWLDLAGSRVQGGSARVALLGISVGGYFALRTVAADDRISAVVANSPIIDLHAYTSAFVGEDPEKLLRPEDDFGVDDLAAIPDSQLSPAMKELTRGLLHRYGQSTLLRTFRYLRQFTVDPAKVRCPSLAMIGAGEGAEPLRQFDEFAKRAGGPVTRRVFTAEEGAEGHCQVGNLAFANAVLFDWLDETIPG